MIKLFYHASENPEGGSLPGVPLRDLTEEEYAAFPTWLQASIAALPCYQTTPPAAAVERAAEPQE